MLKTCGKCENSFEITDADLQFYLKIGPVCGGKKYSIDPPKLCPLCRDQRRLAMRNERSLYTRTSSLSGKKLISMYSPDKPFKIFSFEEWFSDKWDAMYFGRDFDFSRSFFDQFKELREAVPRNSSNVWQSQNCDFCTYTDFSKNCYLVFAGSNCKDTYYSNLVEGVSDCIDLTGCNACELCYDCIDCVKCNNVNACQKCENSHDISFCFECKNCNECLFSFNLRHKEYCIANKQYSKEEYFKKKAEFKFSDAAAYKKYKNQFVELCLAHSIHPYAKIVNCENSTGDNLKNCKNAQTCFDSNNLNDCSYVNFSSNSRDAYDVIGSSNKGCELTCEAMSIEGQNIFAGYYIAGTTDVYYCDTVISCKNVFGCVGTKHKEYCILNKQYSREEYEKLLPKIIEHMRQTGEWGEFFPIRISPFDYKETVAQDYYPII